MEAVQKVSTKYEVQRPESKEELAALIIEDIVEVEGRKYFMRINNNSDEEILNLFGRGGGESVQILSTNYSNIKIDSGRLVITNPNIETLWEEYGEKGWNYNFLRRNLEEVGIWEKE